MAANEVDNKISALEQRAGVQDFQVSTFTGRLEKLENRSESNNNRLIKIEEGAKGFASKEFVVKTAIGAVLAITALFALQTAVQKGLFSAPVPPKTVSGP